MYAKNYHWKGLRRISDIRFFDATAERWLTTMINLLIIPFELYYKGCNSYISFDRRPEGAYVLTIDQGRP